MPAAARAGESREHWLNLEDAARWVRRPYRDLVGAVARQELAATKEHPARKGIWMVRLPVLEAWDQTRSP